MGVAYWLILNNQSLVVGVAYWLILVSRRGCGNQLLLLNKDPKPNVNGVTFCSLGAPSDIHDGSLTLVGPCNGNSD